jgi:outer membrane immunogenic protein
LRLALPTERALFYATGGFAGGDVKFTQTFSDTFSPIALQSIEGSEFLSGWSAGGGIELLIESGASIRVEYLYVDLGDIEATGPIGTGTTTSNGRAAVTNQLVRAGINFALD